MDKIIYRWILVVLWCGIIFYFSSISSLRITYGIWDLILRKIAHAVEFAVLTFLFYQALSTSAERSRGIKTKTALVWAFIFSFFYAISDEIHQNFVFGRHASVLDVGIDGIGIGLVVWHFSKSGASSLLR